ncbi:MAG: ATP-dependent helicase [Pseudomonadales bacterium]
MNIAEHASPHLQGLNTAQARAVTADTGPLLVIAGAGTGKTTTLAHRVAHLILEGARSERILLLTFTRRAAQEMTHRAESIVRDSVKQSKLKGVNTRFEWAGTFHSVANRLLRRYAHTVGLEPSFSVLDRGDAADLLDVARQELKLSSKARRFPKKAACLAIYSRRVNSQKPLQTCLKEAFPWCEEWQPELTLLFRRYVELKQRHQCLDYDDLLLYWYHLVQDEEIAAEIGDFFDHVLVDEYQDTNALQAQILLALKPGGKGLTAVGDDAQSIYSFRAAEIDNILRFPLAFDPPASVVSLEHNYRSVQPILDASNQLMSEGSGGFKKSLRSHRPSKQKPYYITVEDTDAESDYVVEQVLKAREAGQTLNQQAVLFRNSHHSDRLEIELLRRNIPFVKYGGLKFLEATHIKDMLAVLKWADNPKNQPAAYRVLQLLPGMGPANAARCFENLAVASYSWQSLNAFCPPTAAAEDWPAMCTLLQTLGDCSNVEQNWHSQLHAVRRWYQPHMERLLDAPEQREADLEQLEAISAKYPNRERFVTELTLDPPSATGDLAGDAAIDEDYLILSTVHSAKGQEWDSVYILNVTDGNFPNEFAAGDAAQTEEERRLMYVAMTRARNNLHLTVPLKFLVTQQHKHGDKHVFGTRSRFVSDTLLNTMTQSFHGTPLKDTHRLAPKSSKTLDIRGKVLDLF